MRLFDYAAFLVATLLYIPRLLLFFAYRALLFISKPGSLILLPALLGGLFWWQYDFVRSSWLYEWWLNDVVFEYFPHDRIPEDYWYLGFFWVLFTVVLQIVAGGKYQVLGSVLSALPQVRRPFPPTLRLRLVEKKIKPAAVRLVVPKLKRRRRGRNAPNVTHGLSGELTRLLEPPMPSQVRPVELVSEPAPIVPPEPVPIEDEPETVQEQPAKAEPPARPKRKPAAPPLPPKARV